MARQGQIIELAKDRFRLRWYVGRVNGRRQYRSETFSGGKRAAAKRLREILGDKNRGVRPETRTLNASSMTTRAFCPRRLGSGGGGRGGVIASLSYLADTLSIRFALFRSPDRRELGAGGA